MGIGAMISKQQRMPRKVYRLSTPLVALGKTNRSIHCESQVTSIAQRRIRCVRQRIMPRLVPVPLSGYVVAHGREYPFSLCLSVSIQSGLKGTLSTTAPSWIPPGQPFAAPLPFGLVYHVAGSEASRTLPPRSAVASRSNLATERVSRQRADAFSLLITT